MKFKELKLLESSDLKVKLNDLNKDLIKMNAQVATGTAVKNPGQIKQTRKTIAKILTLMNQKPAKTETKVKAVKKKSTEVSKKA